MKWALDIPLEIDSAVKSGGCETELMAVWAGGEVPLLTRRKVGQGQVLMLNVRTFSKGDFVAVNEYLLAPKSLGITKIPRSLADRIRGALLAPLGVQFQAPPGVQLVLLGSEKCVYNFRDAMTRIELGGETIDLAPHAWAWR